MKITSEKEFIWVHNAKETYKLGPHPIEITEEAYKHLVETFGSAWFKQHDSLPKESSEKSSEEALIQKENDLEGVLPPQSMEHIEAPQKKAGRPKKSE